MADKFGWEKEAGKEAAKRGRPEYRPPSRSKNNRQQQRLSSKPGSVVFPFGKHKGQLLKLIPKEYLWWVLYHCHKIDSELVQAIIRVAGNGLKYARERGWAVAAIPPPDQPPPASPGKEREWNWGREVAAMDQRVAEISQESVGPQYVACDTSAPPWEDQ